MFTIFNLVLMENDAKAFFLRKSILSFLNLKQLERKKGGPSKIVEINEFLIVKQMQNNAERILLQKWIFVGICHNGNECLLIQVPNWNAKYLM